MSDASADAPANLGPAGVLIRYWYLLVLVLLFVGSFAYWWRYYAFTDQFYAPEQPIKYSHALHAGEYGIDCKYCHFNAERGKHAGIPPASVCLGCHSPDQGGVGAGKPEVEKLLSFLDFENDAYEIEVGENEAKLVKEGGVVHWERIHLLPDHVYFSHEWHVAAGVSCQTCHGPIEEMEVVYQYSDLTMGWCITCHRNDNYVGGPEFDGKDMSTFKVGVGDYDVIRSRIRPDDVLKFNVEVDAAGEHHAHGHGGHGDEGHGHDHAAKDAVAEANNFETRDNMRGLTKESLDSQGFGRKVVGFDDEGKPVFGEERAEGDVGTLAYFTAGQEAKLELLLKKYPDLPRWRVQDLPESHREFYGLGYNNQSDKLQNAPTHCNTCHQ